MGNEWQVVQNPKTRSKSKQANSKGASTNNLTATAESAQRDPAGAAFAQLDADWTRQNGARKANGTTGGFASLEVESSPPPSPKASSATSAETEQPKKAPKPKKPKIKKLTPSDIAAGLSAKDLKVVLNDFESKYGTAEHSQLERVADYFLGSFKEADIPFNKTVLEQPVSKAGDIPVRDLSQEVVDIMQSYFRRKNVQTLADFAFSLIKALLSDIPESNPSKTPKKAKVGLLITIALIFRSRPEALLLLEKQLLDQAATFSTPGRLPFQLWVIQQAASADLACGIAVWSRAILPQILGRSLPSLQPVQPSEAHNVHNLSPALTDVALKYGEGVLEESEDFGDQPPKATRLGPVVDDPKGLFALKLTETVLLRRAEEGVQVQESGRATRWPVIPPEALEGILQASYSAPSAALRSRLLSLYSALKDLVLVGVANNHTKPTDAVKLLLETASSAAETAGPSGNSIEQSSELLLEYIHADPKAVTSAWEQRHKHQIKGSSAILKYLTTFPIALETFLKSSSRRELLLDTLRHLKDRHRGLLANGKSWQQSAARTAEQAITDLTHRILTKRRQNSAANVLIILVIAALTIVFLGRQDYVQDVVRTVRYNSPVANQFAARLEQAVTASQAQIQELGRSTVGPIWSNVHDWGVAEYNAKLRPHVGSVVSSAIGQLQTAIEKATSFLEK